MIESPTILRRKFLHPLTSHLTDPSDPIKLVLQKLLTECWIRKPHINETNENSKSTADLCFYSK